MIAAGDTLLGLDEWDHLYFVLMLDPASDQAGLANLTSHWPEARGHDNCTVVRPGEHPWVRRDSCIYSRGAMFIPRWELERRIASGRYSQREPLAPRLLNQLQRAAIEHPLTPAEVKIAVRVALADN